MTQDLNKNIVGIEYNHLNLPTQIYISGQGQISYIYDATGVKLNKIVENDAVNSVTSTKYAGNYIYENDNLKFFSQPEGYVEPNGSGGFDYVYQYKDHLGNIRLSYADINQNNTNPVQLEIIEENNYYPFGLEHKGYNVVNGVENNYQTFQGQEISKELGLDAHEFKYRFYYADIGRFWQVDPLADGYVYNSPYNFAENSVIANSELEGLEAKLAIHGESATGNYTQSDNNAFHARASSLEKNHGYSAEGISNGQALISALKTATADEGSVQSAVIFAHGSGGGIYLDPSDGFYNSSVNSNGTNSASVADLTNAVGDGSIAFSRDATIVFGSCNACYQGMSSSLAESITNDTGVTTIGATGYVEPEIVGGKETGKLTTTGTFMKTEKSFTVSFSDADGNVVNSATFSSQNAVDNYSKGFNFDNAYTQNVTSQITQTDLGNVIDPSKL